MSKNNSVTGGTVVAIQAPQTQGAPSRIKLQIPVTKQDGTPANTFLNYDTFNNVAAYKEGSAVLVEGYYRQQMVTDQNGNKRNFQSLVATSIQFTGTKENPVVYPVNEAVIMGNIASDIRRVGQNGGVGYSVALNSWKKPAQQGGQPEAITYYADVVDFTGASNGFVKGQPVYLKGYYRQGSYTNQQGAKVYTTNFIVGKVVFPIAASEVKVQTAAPAQAPAPVQPAPAPAPQPAPVQQSIPADFGQPAPAPAPQPDADAAAGFMDLDGLGIDFSTWQ